jgi:hypothetical protein
MHAKPWHPASIVIVRTFEIDGHHGITNEEPHTDVAMPPTTCDDARGDHHRRWIIWIACCAVVQVSESARAEDSEWRG